MGSLVSKMMTKRINMIPYIEKSNHSTSVAALALSTLGLCALIAGCSPRQDVVYDTSVTNPDIIDSIVLKPSNDYLIADQANVLDLTPVCYYTKLGKKHIIPMENVSDDLFVWHDEAGKEVSRHFSTTDQTLIGKDKTFTVTLKKGKQLKSSPATVHIVPAKSTPQKIVIPIVFHLIQTQKEITETAAHYEYSVFTKQVEKLNRVFANSVVKTATGVDTGIQFALAKYNPIGEKMNEPGLNRIAMEYEIPIGDIDEDDLPDIFEKIITDAPNADWSSENYLNIWLVSEISDKIDSFGDNVLEDRLVPKHLTPTATTEGMPNSIVATRPDEGQELSLYEKGIPFIVQDLLASRQNGKRGTNEFIYYIGRYLGLQSTSSDDLLLTVSYNRGDAAFYLKNNTDVKETQTNFFRSTNIMDDRYGLHTSISQDQAAVMHWTLQNTIGRQAWRSSKALKGE